MGAARREHYPRSERDELARRPDVDEDVRRQDSLVESGVLEGHGSDEEKGHQQPSSKEDPAPHVDGELTAVMADDATVAGGQRRREAWARPDGPQLRADTT